ncbi:MAG: NAD(P)/FAD-dependent oxidoreductase [Methanosarcinales archaeon]|nr:NAD(P)/FAD-dependent oxidoreductase [Methanosarcinales archaeon]
MSRERTVELLVIGAGPAGSTAAEVAASQGREVMLVDKKKEIGTPVQCGGFIPEAHELRELMPRALLPQPLVEIPERCVLHRTTIQRFYSPSGKHLEFPVDGRSVDRRAFDRHLAMQAARAGAEILPATRAELVPGGVKLSGRSSGMVQAKAIIGADGPHSATAREIGAPHGEVGVCLEYEMADLDIDPGAAEMYFSARYAPGGYAWIIPLGSDLANVGVGVRVSYLQKGATLPCILDQFVREHPQAGEKLRGGEVLAVMQGTVPAGGMPPAVQKDNVLLAGDAAGQVMATSGGGIPLAMVAGRIAGEVCSAYLQGEGGLEDYPSRIEEEFGRQLRNSVQIRKLVDVIMRRDRLMDALFSMVAPDQMKEIQRGKIPATLGGICSAILSRGQSG